MEISRHYRRMECPHAWPYMDTTETPGTAQLATGLASGFGSSDLQARSIDVRSPTAKAEYEEKDTVLQIQARINSAKDNPAI